MALSERERQILQFGVESGKQPVEVKAALQKYRLENPQDKKKGFASFKEDIAQTGSAIVNTLQEGTQEFGPEGRIAQRAEDGEISKGKSIFQRAGGAIGTGFAVAGDVLVGLGKAVLPEKAERVLEDVSVATGMELSNQAKKDLETLKQSDKPEERQVASQVEEVINLYQTDETFRDDVKAAGGFMEFVGASKLTKPILSNLRKLEPELDTPYFRTTENAIAEAISNTKKVAEVPPVDLSVAPGSSPSISALVGQKAVDTAVLTGQKMAETYRNLVEGSTKRISQNLDRQALQTNRNVPIQDVERNIGDMYVNAVSPGVKGKKTSLEGLTQNKQQAVSAVKNITQSKNDLQFRDIETNQMIKGELPSNLWEFGGAITYQKSKVYQEVLNRLGKTANEPIDSSRIIEAMDEIINDPVYAGMPQVQKRAREALGQFFEQDYTPAQIERLIQLENDRLQAFYRGSGTQADAIVSAIVANNLRDILDETVEAATGQGVKELKSQYGSLKAIERDVVHRALHNSQAREAGLVDMFGIRTIGDVAAGFSGDLGALKRGAAQIAGEGFIKALNDRDALVNRMFLVSDQAYSNSLPEIQAE